MRYEVECVNPYSSAGWKEIAAQLRATDIGLYVAGQRRERAGEDRQYKQYYQITTEKPKAVGSLLADLLQRGKIASYGDI